MITIYQLEVILLATIKTVEYRCPHCNKKVSSIPRNDYFSMKGNIYGEPFEVCKKCKNVYKSPFTIEPAAEVTLKERVPFWITSVRFMVFVAILAVFSVVLTYGIGLIVVVPFYLAVCALSRNYRQQHKNRLVLQSRERLRDTEYFVRHLVSSVYLPDKSKLTPQALAIIHLQACRTMDADQVLNLSKIVQNVIG